MNASTTRTLTPARFVALVLVVLVAGGLAYLRFAPDSGSVSVPAGAKAGQLALEPCRYETEDGGYRADCGTLVVPENRGDAGSRLIALPVTRIRALSAHPAEPVFRLEGGPGKTNMAFPAASRLADDRDVVLVGYRGVDGSSVLDCPEVESALKHATDLLSKRSKHAYADAFRACAERLTADGVDLRGYSLAQRVDDLEAARVALGYDRIDLVSESAGTRTAMIYSWRFPKSIHRSVMIAANPPGHFLWDGKATDAQIARYARLCAEDDACSRRTDDLTATLRRTAADVPDRWLFLPVKEGNARIAAFYAMMESSSAAAPLTAPLTIGSWLSAADGDASGMWFASLLADVTFPKSFVWGELAAAGRADANFAKRAFASRDGRDASILGDPGTDFTWAGGLLADAWPATPDEDEYDTVRRSNVETLLIGGTLDLATPAANATRELLPYLPNGQQVVLAELGHTISFWGEQPEAAGRLITTYLDSGTVDRSLYRPANVDLTPTVTQTTIAKVLAGAMVGFALLVVVSLLLMVRRVRRRGRFGRKASATLRSLYPAVLGLGGWFLGVLLVLTTMPGVPLDDEVLAVVSAGVPIGLGVHLAWVHRDWSPGIRAMGLAASVGGALVGGWLGFNAASDLLSLLTTIAGATVGANLILLVLDIAWDRQGRDRFASAGAAPALEARPSAG